MATPFQPPAPITTSNTPGTNAPPKLPMRPDVPISENPHNSDVIRTYTLRDVLNGRGQGVQRHPGNVKYRTLVFVNKVSSFWGEDFLKLSWMRMYNSVMCVKRLFVFTITSGVVLLSHHMYIYVLSFHGHCSFPVSLFSLRNAYYILLYLAVGR